MVCTRDNSGASCYSLYCSVAFRTYVSANEASGEPNPDIQVIITGTVIWKSAHTFGDKDLVRLHMTDTEPEESMSELAEVSCVLRFWLVSHHDVLC
jgi:hypothetical protein